MLPKHGLLGKALFLLGLCGALVGCPPDTGNDTGEDPDGVQVAMLVTPEVLDFGTNPADKSILTFTVRKNNTTTALPPFVATVAERDRGWLRVFTVPPTDPPTGTSDGPNDSFTFSVELIRQGLAAGDNVGTITIEAPGVVPRTITVNAKGLVAANFLAEPLDPYKGEAVQFTDLSTVAQGQPNISSWEWDFGDGSPLNTDQNPQHAYADPGKYTVTLRVRAGSLEDVEQRIEHITVRETVLPDAHFSVANTSPEAASLVQFTDLSTEGTAPITSWLWNFGDQTTSTEQNPQHAYAFGGTYTVSLTVTTAHGTDTETQTNLMTVREIKPTADFSATPTDPIFGRTTVQFTDLSIRGTAPITDWLWEFGDGETSTEQNPTHMYFAAGRRTVKLTVSSIHGNDTAEKVDYIEVRTEAPQADFNASTFEEYAGNPIQFTDLSIEGTVPITGWLWTFGDGQTSTEQNPSHTYQLAGVFPVSLTVTSDHGSDTETRQNYITINARSKPAAAFTVSNRTPYATDPVQFTDESDPKSSPIKSWLWNFGDGQTSTEQHPEHTYQNPGKYNVALQVTNDDGTDTLLVANYMDVKATVDPVANFIGAPLAVDPNLGETVQFTDQSNANSAPINTWAWDFGDGETSDEQNPVHAYAAGSAGMRTVSLTVTTNHGTHTATKPAYIMVRPAVNFTAAPTNAAASIPVQFTDLTPAGMSPVATWDWDFGDGLSSPEQNPEHAYGSPGTYTVSLTVTLQDGAVGTLTRENYIDVTIQGPTASFIVSNNKPLMFETLGFTDTSSPGSAPITSWSWTFGDGGASSAQHPFHVYPNAGSYDVTLTVNSPFGSDSITQTIQVGGPQPNASFTQDKSIVLRGLDSVRFTSTATISGTGVLDGYTWWVWKSDSEDVGGNRDYARANGTTYVTSPNSSYWGEPFHEPGMYNVSHIVTAGIVVNPGDPDDPRNLVGVVSSGITKLNAIEVIEPTALDLYIRRNEPVGQYTVEGPLRKANGYRSFLIDLPSLQWTAPGAVTPTTWRHWLTVIQPDDVTNNTALLYLDGGTVNNPAPTQVDPRLAQFAVDSGSVVAVLDRIPNQPLASPGPRRKPQRRPLGGGEHGRIP